MQRREFLLSAAAVAGLASTGRAEAQGAADRARLDRISIMTLNFHALLKLPGQPSSPERNLEVFDLPEMFADTYGVHNLEFQHYHLPSTEPSYYRDLRAKIDKTKSQVTQLVMEFGGLNISAPDHNFLPRIQAIDLTKVWIDRAVVLGCPRVMVNQGQPSEGNKAYAIETLTVMGEYAKSKGVRVSMETRGNGGAARGAAPASAPTADVPAIPPTPTPAALPPAPAWILLNEIIKASGTYCNIDVGGIGAANQEDLHGALRTLIPVSHGSMHIKRSAVWDLPTALKFIAGLGYTGLYSIEARGHEATRDIYNTILASG